MKKVLLFKITGLFLIGILLGILGNLKLPACPYYHSTHIWRNGYAPVKIRYLSSDANQPVMLKLQFIIFA